VHEPSLLNLVHLLPPPVTYADIQLCLDNNMVINAVFVQCDIVMDINGSIRVRVA